MISSLGGERDWRRLTALAFSLGAALQLWLWGRPVWVYRDQTELYTLGMELVRDGRLAPFGKLMTGDFAIPGGLLQLLIGLPLMVWQDLRSPTLLLVGFHLVAGWLLLRTSARRYGWQVAGLFAAVLWLSPWRLYHSGFLWEANYLLLPAAVHLWACDALESRRRFGPSLALGITLTATAQIHGSVLIVALATVWLAWRGRIRPHLPGVAAGLAIGGITLWPTLAALLGGATPPPSAAGALGLLARANSVQKTLLYWFRFGSLDVGRRYRQSVLCRLPGSDEAPQPVLCGATRLTEIAALASVAVALAAGWWFLRRRRAARGDDRDEWTRCYCLAMLGSSLLAAAVSPVLIQGWQLLLVLPAACLPVALWIRDVWPRCRPWLRWALLAYLVWRIPAVVLLGLGHPMYATPPDPEMLEHVVPERLLPLFGGGGL